MPCSGSDGGERDGDPGGIEGRVIQAPQGAVGRFGVGDVRHEQGRDEHQEQEEQGQDPLLHQGEQGAEFRGSIKTCSSRG